MTRLRSSSGAGRTSCSDSASRRRRCSSRPWRLSVARDVLVFLGDQIRRVARKEGEAAVDRIVDRAAGRDEDEEVAAPAPDGPAELTDEQLDQVRALALEKAKLLKLPDAKAALLADSLVGSLATA